MAPFADRPQAPFTNQPRSSQSLSSQPPFTNQPPSSQSRSSQPPSSQPPLIRMDYHHFVQGQLQLSDTEKYNWLENHFR